MILYRLYRIARARIRDTVNAVKLRARGDVCQVTGDHIPPGRRVDHELHEHPDRGPCIRL